MNELLPAYLTTVFRPDSPHMLALARNCWGTRYFRQYPRDFSRWLQSIPTA